MRLQIWRSALFMNHFQNLNITFITGTDTGVGKTVLTASLLNHLRRNNVPALALKPFCCGNRADAELLYELQDGELSLQEINPFYFSDPVAPLVAARKQRRLIELNDVLRRLSSVAQDRVMRARSSRTGRQKPQIGARFHLLIEGCGGLLVPLGRGFTVLDLISALGCNTIVVSQPRAEIRSNTVNPLPKGTSKPPQPSISRWKRAPIWGFCLPVLDDLARITRSWATELRRRRTSFSSMRRRCLRAATKGATGSEK